MEDGTPAAATTKSSPALGVVWNVPNILTVSRLVLSIFCFVCFVGEWYLAALIFFAIAAGTDWVDGFWARRYGQVTQLGRILDPFADKVVICGTFIFLAAVPPILTGASASEVTAWMAVVVVARELLVTALRGFFEERGTDFSAKWSGKWKMVAQCAAVAGSLARLWYYGYHSAAWTQIPPDWTTWALRLTVWTAVAMTVYSGWVYVQRALTMLRK
jgi:CDP-diacylglycerol--glycerol-3-phosphate 3-phosphatidyltransferase